MPFDLVGKLRRMFEGNPDVRKVAEDPSLSAELLLLFRMILADGKVEDVELAKLKRICRDAFGIEQENFSQVVRYLQDFGYETHTGQALAMMREFPHARRVALARHMAEIAKADSELGKDEVRLLTRALEVLELKPQDIAPSA